MAKLFIDFEETRRGIKIADVLDLLGVRLNSFKGHQARGPCPVHGSGATSRALSVHLVKGIWRCMKCGGEGNVLDLYRLARDLPLYEATIELCNRLGFDPCLKRAPQRREGVWVR